MCGCRETPFPKQESLFKLKFTEAQLETMPDHKFDHSLDNVRFNDLNPGLSQHKETVFFFFYYQSSLEALLLLIAACLQEKVPGINILLGLNLCFLYQFLGHSIQGTSKSHLSC